MRQTDWDGYYEYVNHFFRLEEAMALFDNYVRALVGRRNSFTGVAYSADPTIVSWEIANEPRGGRLIADEYAPWVRRVAKLLKGLDPNHLVTVGSEGTGGNGPFRQDFDTDDVDYTALHLWPERWGWYKADADAESPNGLRRASSRMMSFISSHVDWSEAMNKPLVIEGFALSRDLAALDPAGPTRARDDFFGSVLATAHGHMKGGRAVTGVSFWAWGGEGRPAARLPDEGVGLGWQEGDALVGDPPSETQGLYSVYSTDATTCKVIAEWSAKINAM